MSFFLAFAGFAALIILHEFGHFAAAKAVGMRVERFALFFPPLIARKQVGETEYAIGAVPFGGYVKISGMNPDEKLPDEARTRAYFSQPVWKRVVVIAAGPAMNLLIAFLLLLVFFWQIGPERVGDQIGTIQRGFPAVGTIHAGDRLVSVDGVRGSPETLSRAIARHRCPGTPKDGCTATSAATVVLKRDGRLVRLRLKPVYDGQAKRTRLGFGFAPDGREPFAFHEALNITKDRFWYITKQTASLPARLFNARKRKQITGTVGAYEVTRQTILQDLGEVVGILAIISLSLAIVNLFPFLPLDGGHIFWAVVEKVRRKPVPYSVMERAGALGFALVIGLFIIGLTNDIDRLSGQGFNVR